MRNVAGKILSELRKAQPSANLPDQSASKPRVPPKQK
jgi:hypothetical protein